MSWNYRGGQIDDGTRKIATVHPDASGRDEGHLIASAPDLLAALEDVARWINTLPEEIKGGSIMPEKLAGVIAKAGGER